MPNLKIENSISISEDPIPEEANALRKHSAGLLDALIFLITPDLIVYFIVLPIIGDPTLYIDGSCWIFLAIIIFRFVCFLLFDRTIGMSVSGIILLNTDLKKLSILEKFFASFFILINGINYYRLPKKT